MADKDKDDRGLSWGVLSWPNYFMRPHEKFAAIAYAFLALVLLAVLAIAVSLLLRVLFAAFGPENLEPIKSADDFNKILLGLGGLIGAVTAVPFLIWRTLIAQKQNSLAQENLHSTTMVKAIEQLGAMKEEKVTQDGTDADGKPTAQMATNSRPNIELRLGAIYLLEKLAREHEQLHWPIMEILCAYVRENAGPPQGPPKEVVAAYASGLFQRSVEQRKLIEQRERTIDSPRVDVQAAITVIGRRSATQVKIEKFLLRLGHFQYRLDFSNCNLYKLHIDGMNFDLANFSKSCLELSSFRNINLSNTNFSNSYLQGASIFASELDASFIQNANLQGASIMQSTLINCNFANSNFDGAGLMGNRLHGSDFSDANFRKTNLFRNHFEATYLAGTNFEKADITGSVFDDAWIFSADFTTAKGFMPEMAARAWGRMDTNLPEGIEKPASEKWAFDPNIDILELYNKWQKRHEYWTSEALKVRMIPKSYLDIELK